MDVQDRVIVVTGAGRGIGRGLCHAAARAGAAGIVVSDQDLAAATDVADAIGPKALANRCDVAVEGDVQSLVKASLARFGRIDMFCSNAGITVKGGLDASNSDWQRMWDVNVMSRVFAARAVLPHMLEVFASEVVPILQKRGRFRTEYAGTTLRQHYGLARPTV